MPRVKINGVGMHWTELGRGRPLVLLHGFTGSGEQWMPTARALASERRCVLLDSIGHGRSEAPRAPERYSMAHCVADLAAVLDRLGIERTDVLGYSMGGRLALAFALARPGRIGTLVLEGASPGLAEDGQRRERREADARWAELIERDGVETFVDAWMKQPLFASQERLGSATLAAERERRCRTDPIGLANSLRGLGTGTQEPLWTRLREVTAPTLLIVGEEDAKFRSIAAEMASRMPCAEVRVIPDSGHTTHLENPEVFVTVVTGFLRCAELVPSSASQGRRPEAHSKEV